MMQLPILNTEKNNLWHPCSQMKDYEIFKPLQIKKAYGPWLELENGKKIIDAISSWWCKSLGHNHPMLKKALFEQMEKFEHVILGNTVNNTITELSKKIANLTKSLDKVFYASDGSCAIEIAIKMSLHAQKLKGENQRTHFFALTHGYHGETGMALSLSDLGLYRAPYESILYKNISFIKPPYVSNKMDPVWENCEEEWQEIEKELNKKAQYTTAIILEPIVQGAGGMRIYSKDFLRRIRQWTKENNIYLIADEIMTGFGRTGFPIACEHADIEPDFLCLGKGLTSGWLPMSAVATSSEIYYLFYGEDVVGKAFLHSHTYSGNALAASIALACFDIMEAEDIYLKVKAKEAYLVNLMSQVMEETKSLINIRNIGFVVAADLVGVHPEERIGYKVYQKAVELGALLRPLGNTIYWLPPLNCTPEVLQELQEITIKAIQGVDW